jgi:hypothetical protein
VGAHADLIQRANEHLLTTGDFLLEAYAEDIVFVTRGELAGSTEYRGRDGFSRAMSDFREISSRTWPM